MLSVLTRVRKKLMSRFRSKERPRPMVHVRPRLEALEDRLVLDAMRFTGGAQGIGTDYAVATNWANDTNPLFVHVPNANDTVSIPTGFGVVLGTAGDYTAQSLTVNSGSSLLIGSTTAQSNVTLTVSGSTSDTGTITVGAAAGGSTATLDTSSMSLGSGSAGGTLNVGDPSTGNSGTVDVTNTLSALAGTTINVGGTGTNGGSTGTLDVGTLSSSAALSINLASDPNNPSSLTV